MIVSTITVWTANPFATKLGLIVHYHKPECFMEKLDCCAQGQGHNNKNLKINECLCRWYFLNHWTFYYQTWYGDASLWARLSLKKDWFAVFKVKVTVKDNIIKIWLFNILSELLILLQLNLLVGTSLCCEKIGLLCCHPGQGQRRGSEFWWMFIWKISPQLLNLL